MTAVDVTVTAVDQTGPDVTGRLSGQIGSQQAIQFNLNISGKKFYYTLFEIDPQSL